MAGRGKYFELLDVAKFAVPNVSSIDAGFTASNLAERLFGPGGFMSYGQMWPRIHLTMAGLATDQFIESEFSAYKAVWKNKAIQDAFRLLRDTFGGRGNWYRMPSVRTYVLGVWFKSSIKGYWACDGKVYAVLINARKGQCLTRDDVLFLGRGVYELHCRDNPADPTPLIIDLGVHPQDQDRRVRVYQVQSSEAAPLEAFESTLREFLVALNIAGVGLPPPPKAEHILDLFRS